MKSYLLLIKAGGKNMDTKEAVKYRESLGIDYIADVTIKRCTHFLNVFFLIYNS